MYRRASRDEIIMKHPPVLTAPVTLSAYQPANISVAPMACAAVTRKTRKSRPNEARQMAHVMAAMTTIHVAVPGYVPREKETVRFAALNPQMSTTMTSP